MKTYYTKPEFISDRKYTIPKGPTKLVREVRKIVRHFCSPDVLKNYVTKKNHFTRRSKCGLERFVLMKLFSREVTQTQIAQDYFGIGKQKRVTSSALTQIKAKVKPEFFEDLLREVNRLLDIQNDDLIAGKYLPVSIDGSNLPVPLNKDEKENIVHRKKGSKEPIRAGLHMNLMSVTSTGYFLGCVVQSQKAKNERKAAIELIEQYHTFYEKKGIIPVFIMDRGYFSYLIALICEKYGYKYLIRTKTREFRSLAPDLVEKEGIEDVSKILTWHQRKQEKADSRYKYASRKSMNSIEEGAEFVDFTACCVSLKLDEDSHSEYLITNLDLELTLEDYSELYHRRWSIETTIGQLKYAADLKKIHSRKAEWIKQEIYASLITFNISCRMAQMGSEAKEEAEDASGKSGKHEYKINLTEAIRTTKKFVGDLLFPGRKKASKTTDGDFLSDIASVVACIRENRSFRRNLHPNRLIYFTWR